ncbi:hypothetical protein ACJA3J_05675 [Halobacillus sp. SY10]|uniref:hypothetical protein n=1 Tax=Halobacillus sp. SY10 TaxID=3381356 RepID=UPI00387A318B
MNAKQMINYMKSLEPGEMDVFKLEGAFFEVKRLDLEDENEVMESIKNAPR